MTADIELLPVAQCTNETALALADAPRSLRNYVAALQAEIEALRSRLEDLVRNDLNEQCRAWRLAEALREATDLLLSDYPEEAKRLRAALHSHRLENIKDEV